MSSNLSQQVLVLNKSWIPVGTVSVQRAIVMLFSETDDNLPKARIIEPTSYATFTWNDWSKLKPHVTDKVIRSVNMMFRCPEVIQLTTYDKIPQPKTHFSRYNLFKRDKYRCLYCGCQPGTELLTIDHVMPSSRGGTTSWENCVLACVECNSRKANRTPEEAGMKLLKKPVKPNFNLFHLSSLKPVKSWQALLGEAYWNIELAD